MIENIQSWSASSHSCHLLSLAFILTWDTRSSVKKIELQITIIENENHSADFSRIRISFSIILSVQDHGLYVEDA